MTNYHYDEEADVLYVSFGRSEHVTGVELAPNVLLRLDIGSHTQPEVRPIGLTLVSYSKLREKLQGQTLTLSLNELRNLPEDIWRAVVKVVMEPPVSEVLGVAFTISLPVSTLPNVEVASI